MKFLIYSLFIFFLFFFYNCSSIEEKEPTKSAPKEETQEIPSKPKESKTSDRGIINEEETKFANQPVPSDYKDTQSNKPEVGKVQKNCEPYDEFGEKTKCTGSISSLKGETFLEFGLRNSQKAHIGFELTVEEGEIQVAVQEGKSGIAKKGRSFVYLGLVSKADPLKISLNSENKTSKSLEYRITIFH